MAMLRCMILFFLNLIKKSNIFILIILFMINFAFIEKFVCGTIVKFISSLIFFNKE